MSAFITQALLLPEGFPQTAPAPRFRLGDRVRFIPTPAEDSGLVIGLQYAPAEHLQAWGWRYMIWLDAQSPSHAWTCTDLAWEDDLERLVPVPMPSAEQSG